MRSRRPKDRLVLQACLERSAHSSRLRYRKSWRIASDAYEHNERLVNTGSLSGSRRADVFASRVNWDRRQL